MDDALMRSIISDIYQCPFEATIQDIIDYVEKLKCAPMIGTIQKQASEIWIMFKKIILFNEISS